MSNKHVFKHSTSIEHCDFDDNTNTLGIKFFSGPKEHAHQNCPKEIDEGLKKEDTPNGSPGGYFHRNIRSQYKVKP